MDSRQLPKAVNARKSTLFWCILLHSGSIQHICCYLEPFLANLMLFYKKKCIFLASTAFGNCRESIKTLASYLATSSWSYNILVCIKKTRNNVFMYHFAKFEKFPFLRFLWPSKKKIVYNHGKRSILGANHH